MRICLGKIILLSKARHNDSLDTRLLVFYSHSYSHDHSFFRIFLGGSQKDVGEI